LVKGNTSQGSNPGGNKKNPLAGNPKNSATVLTCGACGWFGPCYHGIDAVVANPEDCGHPLFFGFTQEGHGWLPPVKGISVISLV